MRSGVGIQTYSLQLCGLLTLVILALPVVAQAQLRVVTYNTHFDGPFPGLGTVLEAIGQTERNGIAKPIDVLLLQEQDGPFGDTQAIVDILNGIYGAGTYDHGDRIVGSTTSFDRQTIIYNTNTIQPLALADEVLVGSTSTQPRQAIRYRLQPVGYNSTAQFYIYNSHYKASDDSASEATRLVEANAIRTNADALPDDSHIIFAGDHNFYRSTDNAFGRLTSAGDAQAIDPINRVGSWHNNSSFADVHTQAPCFSGCPTGFTTGGVDDRFDFQLVTAEFLDNEGLSYISGSYQAFGNNGSLPCCNSNINDPGNTVTFPGVTSFTRQQILDALFTASDHLPVVADYQLPAILSALASAVPATLNVGDVFNLELTVSNAADVLQPIGADELDYSITTTHLGALMDFSSFNQMDMALGGGNSYQIQLDTLSVGMKTDILTIAGGGQGVPNGLIEIPISYQVLAAGIAGDYNGNGIVDAADYTVWRDTLGSMSDLRANGDDTDTSAGVVDAADYDYWKVHFGETSPGAGSRGGGATARVPEPVSQTLVLIGVLMMLLAAPRVGDRRSVRRESYND
jgi:endonuclease/exonuclease/phosphatase family metal-dependent hydrolase